MTWQLSDGILAAFTVFNALQLVSYVPQIVCVIRDRNGVLAISYTAWAIWFAGSATTMAYALVNIWDVWLASVNAVHAVCCAAVILLTAYKRQLYRRQTRALPADDQPKPPDRKYRLSMIINMMYIS